MGRRIPADVVAPLGGGGVAVTVPNTGWNDNGTGQSPNGNYVQVGPIGPALRSQPPERQLMGYWPLVGGAQPAPHGFVAESGNYVPAMVNVTIKLQAGGPPLNVPLVAQVRNRPDSTDAVVAWPIATDYETGDWARDFMLFLPNPNHSPFLMAPEGRDHVTIDIIQGFATIL